MAATLTTLTTTTHNCGCTGVYGGPMGALIYMVKCDAHAAPRIPMSFARTPGYSDDAALADLAAALTASVR